MARQTPTYGFACEGPYNIVSHGLRFLLGSCHAAGAVTPHCCGPLALLLLRLRLRLLASQQGSTALDQPGAKGHGVRFRSSAWLCRPQAMVGPPPRGLDCPEDVGCSCRRNLLATTALPESFARAICNGCLRFGPSRASLQAPIAAATGLASRSQGRMTDGASRRLCAARGPAPVTGPCAMTPRG